MNEEWKDIKGYEGLYRVSSLGNVFSIPKGRTLAKRYDCKGYRILYLSKEGCSKNFKAHRIVYETFVGEIPSGYEIDHINGIRDDNRVENLRAVTHKDNMNNPCTIEKMKVLCGELSHNWGRKASSETKEKIRSFLLSDKNPRRGKHLSDNHKKNISKANKGRKVTNDTRMKLSKPIFQYSKNGVFIREWLSATAIQNELGFCKTNICKCCKGFIPTAYGFIWKYKHQTL